MRVPDGRDAMGGGGCRRREHAGQLGARPRRGARDVVGVERVERVEHGLDDARATRAVGLEHVDEAAERREVLIELPHLEVEEGELQALQPVQRAVAGRGEVAVRRGLEGELARDVRVRGGLDEQVHPVADDPDLAIARLDRLDDVPVRPEHEPLGLEPGQRGRHEAEVGDEHRGRGILPRPLGGHRALHAEPHRAPRATPRVADGDGRELLRRGDLERHGLARHGPRGDLQRCRRAVAGRLHAVAAQAVDALQAQSVVGVHAVIP